MNTAPKLIMNARPGTSPAKGNRARMVFIIVLLLTIGQAVYYFPLLPDRVAVHFGVTGRPDAWSSKEFFVTLYIAAVATIAILFPGIGCVLRKTPFALINLPNKDYWLSTDRGQETIDLLSRQFLWFGSATLLLLLDMFHQSFRVHLGKAQTLGHPVASIAVYVGFSVLWSIGLAAKFMRRP